MTLSVDDSYFDYAFNLTTAELSLLAETTEGTAFVSQRDREIGIVKGNKIIVYSSTLSKKLETKRSEKSRIANFSLLQSPMTMFIREQGTGYDVATFNLQTSVETAIDSISMPYAILAPNGRTAITPRDGGDSAQFVELPNA